MMLIGVVILTAVAGAANGQPGDLFELGAGGSLDWTPTSGALATSSGSKITADGVLTSPFGSALYSEAAGPGVSRSHVSGSFANPAGETRRLDPSTFTRATTRLTVSGSDGVVKVRFKAHIDATLVHSCPGSFRCTSAITIFVGDQNTVVFGPGGIADPNLLGLSVDPIPNGFHVHGDYVSAPRPVFANSPFDAQLSLQLALQNLGGGAAASSSWDAQGEVSFPAVGTVLDVPEGYTVSGENVEDNRWTDPFAPVPTPEIELRFADGSLIGPTDVFDLGTIPSGATSPAATFTIANTGAATLHVQTLTAPTGFAVDDQPDGTVAPGATTSAGLTCSSMNPGTTPVVLDGVVTVASDDPDDGSLDLHVRCTVLPESPPEPDIELRDESDTPLPPPYLLDLGDVASGNPATAGYRIANVGTGQLTITDITNDAPPGLGSATAPAVGTVQPGDSTTAGVSCGGVNSGENTINVLFRVEIFSNDPDEGLAALLVRCRVLPASKPDIALFYDDEPMSANAVIDLGDVPSGDTVTRSYRIANTGDATLTIGSIRATVPSSGTSSASDPDDSTIDPGDSARAQFSCGGSNTSDTPLDVEFEVRIDSDDPDENPSTFAVRCQILPGDPEIELRYTDGTLVGFEDTIELGPVAIGEWSAPGLIEVHNVGTANLTWYAAFFNQNLNWRTSGGGSIVAPGASDVAELTCRGVGFNTTATVTFLGLTAFGDLDESLQVRILCVAVDTTPPTLTLPTSFSVDATSPAGATATYLASASDLVDPTPTLSCVPASGAVFPIGTTAVKCTATDDAGNSASGSFTITVRGAAVQITALIEKTEAFVDRPAIEAALRVMLQAASQALAAKRKPTTCAALAVYIIGVRAVPGGILSPAGKSELIADATRIRTVIGC